MNECALGRLGHNPARHGYGCSGCDAAHARMVEKHLGKPPVTLTGRVTAIDLDSQTVRVTCELPLESLNMLGAAALDKREVLVTVPHTTSDPRAEQK